MARRKTSLSEPEFADTLEYLEQWASQLADAVSPQELESLIAEYRSIASNKRLPNQERNMVRKRAKQLRKLL